VREALGHHTPGGHALKTVVANRRRRAQRFFGVSGFELHVTGVKLSVLRRGVAPDPR
jgi:hypothetical protein